MQQPLFSHGSLDCPDLPKGEAMAPAILEQEQVEKLTEEQKRTILEDYAAAMRGEVVDARAALEKIRAAHGF